MKFSILFGCLLFASCQKVDSIRSERVEAAYIFDNSVFYDGCEEHVRLAGNDSSGVIIEYKPTATTLPLLQRALKQIPVDPNSSERAVIIRFTETGRQVELVCGWAGTHKIGEIEILSITKR